MGRNADTCEKGVPDERCFTIHVADQAAKFEGSSIEVEGACDTLNSTFGATASLWFYPTLMTDGQMPLLTWDYRTQVRLMVHPSR